MLPADRWVSNSRKDSNIYRRVRILEI